MELEEAEDRVVVVAFRESSPTCGITQTGQNDDNSRKARPGLTHCEIGGSAVSFGVGGDATPEKLERSPGAVVCARFVSLGVDQVTDASDE